MNAREMERNDVVPRPDPSVMTSQALQREIAALKELVNSRFEGMDRAVLVLQDQANRSPSINEVFLKHEEMFKSIDKQLAALDASNSRVLDLHKTAIVEAKDAADSERRSVVGRISQLEQLHDERFRSIQVQFVERDTRTEQISKQSEVAINAALQAAKEAVNAQQVSNAASITKSETSTTKQIDQLGITVQGSTNSLDGKITDMKNGMDSKIGDLKERITTVESRTAGIAQGSTDSRKQTTDLGALVIAGIGVMVAVVAAGVAIAALMKH